MVRSTPTALFLLCVSAAVRTIVAREQATATGCPGTLPESEAVRLAEFKRIHKRWPPKFRFPGRVPSNDTLPWRKYLHKKEKKMVAETDPEKKWEGWLELGQIVLLRNFTATGWAIGSVPEKVHKHALEEFREKHAQAIDEGPVALYITGDRGMVTPGKKVRTELVEVARAGIAKWARMKPEDLELTSFYGTRVYYNGSTLNTHVDRVESHILSCVYAVDRSDDGDPWPMVTDPDLTGEKREVELKPGELFFYESAKLAHGRPSVMTSRYSAHIFIHFRPIGWNFMNEDRVYSLPEHWHGNKMPRRPVKKPANEL